MADVPNNDVGAVLPRVATSTLDDSPLAGRVVLLSGGELALRAAATALSAHPSVRVAPVPTRIFEDGLRRLAGSWAIGRMPGPSEGHGLSALFDAPTMTHELRALADALLVSVRADCDVLVDEAPRDVIGLQLASLLYPDACFVHAHWTRDQSGRAATARARITDSGVLHQPLSIDALLDAPGDTLEPILACVGAQGSLAPTVLARLDKLAYDARAQLAPRRWTRTMRRFTHRLGVSSSSGRQNAQA